MTRSMPMPSPRARPLQALRTVLGGACGLCGLWCGDALCDACRAAHAGPALRCPRCACRLETHAAICGSCVRSPPPYAAAIAAVDYAFPWDRLIGGFKFADRLELAAALSDLLLAAVARAGDAAACDAVTAVPLADTRQRARGYNQAWELARRIARRLDLPARPDALLRLHDAPPQAGLARTERLANLRGAYLAEPRTRGWLQGRSIALVDDVMTTGATLAEASEALLRGGAREVRVWVLARTDPGDD